MRETPKGLGTSLSPYTYFKVGLCFLHFFLLFFTSCGVF